MKSIGGSSSRENNYDSDIKKNLSEKVNNIQYNLEKLKNHFETWKTEQNSIMTSNKKDLDAHKAVHQSITDQFTTLRKEIQNLRQDFEAAKQQALATQERSTSMPVPVRGPAPARERSPGSNAQPSSRPKPGRSLVPEPKNSDDIPDDVDFDDDGNPYMKFQTRIHKIQLKAGGPHDASSCT